MIVLMGLRGSGKSTLGARLARELKRPFVDLDDVTSAAVREAHDLSLDASISDMFRDLGEPAFREAEAAALRGLLDAGERSLIVALGGGTPTAPGAADALRDAQASGLARLVYLRLEPSTLAERIASDDPSDRPALMGSDAASEAQAVFDARDPLYLELADRVIDLDAADVDSAIGALRSVLA